MTNKINELIGEGAFNKVKEFGELLNNPRITKRYSIMKTNFPYPIGNDRYKTTFCFFFYSAGYLIKTFYCEVTGSDKFLSNPEVYCYPFPCNDVNRADCWEWVNVA